MKLNDNWQLIAKCLPGDAADYLRTDVDSLSLSYCHKYGVRYSETNYLEQNNSAEGKIITYCAMMKEIDEGSSNFYPIYICYFYDEEKYSLYRQIEEVTSENIEEENIRDYFEMVSKFGPQRHTLLLLYESFLGD